MTRILLLLSLLTALTFSASAALAQPLTCGGTTQAGATLLFPYFEVDLNDAAKVTTLVSIQNTSSEPVLTRVVMWTNCAVPVLAFDLYLDAGAVRPIDLGAVIRDGFLPSSGPEGDAAAFPGCSTPLTLPSVDLEDFQARLSGAWVQGLCYAARREGASSVEGYLTADVVKSCSTGFVTPADEGYFDAETGVAANDNVLWGETFLIEEAEDLAQGFAAVTLRAGGELRPDGHSFYRNGDLREILPMGQTAHYLNGGSFDGGTELLYWFSDVLTTHPTTQRPPHGPWNCVAAADRCTWRSEITVRGRREAGGAPVLENKDIDTAVGRLKVGTDLPVESPFGSLELCKLGSFPEFIAAESWILPVHTAKGRFSVGLRTRGECPFDEPATPANEGVPRWLNALIHQLECSPRGRYFINRYDYSGDLVYAVGENVPDGGLYVFNENGGLRCAIYTNSGDFGGCDDFFSATGLPTSVWEDPR